MFSFRKLFARKPTTYRRRPMLEEFEPRLVPSTVWPGSGTFHGPWDLASAITQPTPPKPFGGPPPPAVATDTWCPLNPGGTITSHNWSYLDGSGNSNWLDNTGARATFFPGGTGHTGDVAQFDAGTGTTKDSDCTLDGAYTIQGLKLTANYTHTLSLNSNNLTATYTFNMSGASATVDMSGATLDCGDMDWLGGKLTGTSSGKVKIEGDGTASSFQFVSNGTLDKITLQVGNGGVTSTPEVDEGLCSSGDNLAMTNSATIQVKQYAFWYFNQNSNQGTSGGITSDGSSNIMQAGLHSFWNGGSIYRELSTRHSGDNPATTAVVVAVPVVVADGGLLKVGDHLGLSISGAVSHLSLTNNSGTVQLAGGSILTLSEEYWQYSGTFIASDGEYNPSNSPTLTVTTAGDLVAFAGGAVKLPMYYAGATGTNGANQGTFQINAPGGAAFKSDTAKVNLDMAIDGWGTSSKAYDCLSVNNLLNFAAGTNGTCNVNIVTYGTNVAAFNIFYWGTEGGIDNSGSPITWNYSGAFGPLTVTNGIGTSSIH